MIWSLVRDVPASDTLVTLVSPIDNTSGSTPDGVFVDDDMDGDDVDGVGLGRMGCVNRTYQKDHSHQC